MRGTSISKSNGNDRVMTPDWLAIEAVQWAGDIRGLSAYEPCAGTGSFERALSGAGAKVEWAEIDRSRDFFSFSPVQAVDLVMTNPPYSVMGEFIDHMIRTIRPKRMILLAPLANLTTRKRLRVPFEAGYGITRVGMIRTIPREWPSTGFQHALVEYTAGGGGSWGYL